MAWKCGRWFWIICQSEWCQAGLDHMKHQTSEQEKETVRLKLHQTLQEQGLAKAEAAILCCTYVPTQLHTAWCFPVGLEPSEAEFSLEGATDLRTRSRVGFLNPPKSLISFTFGDDFDESLKGLTARSAKFDFWKAIQPEFGTCELAKQSAEFDFWT